MAGKEPLVTWMELAAPVASHHPGEIAEPTLFVFRAAMEEVTDLGWMQSAFTRERLVNPRLVQQHRIGRREEPAVPTRSRRLGFGRLRMLQCCTGGRILHAYVQVRAWVHEIYEYSLSLLYIYLVSLGFLPFWALWNSCVISNTSRQKSDTEKSRKCKISQVVNSSTPQASGTAFAVEFWWARCRTEFASGSSE